MTFYLSLCLLLSLSLSRSLVPLSPPRGTDVCLVLMTNPIVSNALAGEGKSLSLALLLVIYPNGFQCDPVLKTLAGSHSLRAAPCVARVTAAPLQLDKTDRPAGSVVTTTTSHQWAQELSGLF